MKTIERYFNVIDKSLFYHSGTLDYDGLTRAFIKLSDSIMDRDTTEEIWYLGEFKTCDLPTLIEGAYWHFTEWHAGQDSLSYAAMCSLGRVFSPNMATVEPDNFAYQQLNELAEKE